MPPASLERRRQSVTFAGSRLGKLMAGERTRPGPTTEAPESPYKPPQNSNGPEVSPAR